MYHIVYVWPSRQRNKGIWNNHHSRDADICYIAEMRRIRKESEFLFSIYFFFCCFFFDIFLFWNQWHFVHQKLKSRVRLQGCVCVVFFYQIEVGLKRRPFYSVLDMSACVCARVCLCVLDLYIQTKTLLL